MRVICSSSVKCGSSRTDALTAISGAGFEFIDLLAIDGWVHLNPSALTADYDSVSIAVDRELAEHGLTLAAMNIGTSSKLWERSDAANRARTAEVKALGRFMADRGVAIAAVQPLNNDPNRSAEEAFGDVLESVRQMIADAAELPVKLAFELHVNSPFETIEAAKRLLSEVPEADVVYDATHFVMQGLSVTETGWIMDRAAHVHLRDAGRGEIQMAFGRGSVDLTG